jgi:hypothetical protein
VAASAAMAEGKAALMGFLAGGIVVSGLFVMMQRRETKKSEKSARRQVFMKDEGLKPSLLDISQLLGIFLGVLVRQGICEKEIVFSPAGQRAEDCWSGKATATVTEAAQAHALTK